MVPFSIKTHLGGVKCYASVFIFVLHMLYRIGFYLCHYLLNQRPDVWIFPRLIHSFNGMNNRAVISIIETLANLV